MSTIAFIHTDGQPISGTSSMEVCQRAGISYRQLDFWTRTGRIEAINRYVKQGIPRAYSEEETAVAVTAKRLLDAGFVTDSALLYARQLVSGGKPLALADGLVILTTIGEQE